jgi:hypothetical protein
MRKLLVESPLLEKTDLPRNYPTSPAHWLPFESYYYFGHTGDAQNNERHPWWPGKTNERRPRMTGDVRNLMLATVL